MGFQHLQAHDSKHPAELKSHYEYDECVLKDEKSLLHPAFFKKGNDHVSAIAI